MENKTVDGPYKVMDRGWGLSITGGPDCDVFYSYSAYGNVINEICDAKNRAHVAAIESVKQLEEG